METVEILHELTNAQGLPREALEAATDRRSDLTPTLIDVIEATLASPADQVPSRTPVFFAFHLLGAWRETSAYRPLCRLLHRPTDEVEALIGDATIETSHRVIASVFDGDLQPIFDIILDPQADEFVRGRMCEALAMLVLRGRAEREPVARFLRDGFMNLLPQSENYVWYGWQSAIAMLGLRDFGFVVKKAYERGFVDRSIQGFDRFEAELDQGVRHPGDLGERQEEYSLFGDAVDELSGWASFSEKPDNRSDAPWSGLPHPTTNPFRGVGRNDPCPCGSGKKFKKCCLQHEIA